MRLSIFNSLLLARDVTIKRYQQLPYRNNSGILDSKLEWHPAPTVGLPLLWTEKHDIRTFVQAYDDPDIRPLVQKMISKAKKRAFNLPSAHVRPYPTALNSRHFHGLSVPGFTH